MQALDLTRLPETDPLKIYRYRDGIYAVDLLIVAVVNLDFFTWLAAHSGTKADICRGLQLAERPTDVMLTMFAALGLVQQQGGVFTVTKQAKEHLVKGSQWYLGPYYVSLADRPVCKDLLQVLRKDKAAN